MLSPEAELEDLIAHFSRGLSPADREAFRRATEGAIASSPEPWGLGSIHRALVPLGAASFVRQRSSASPTVIGRRRSGFRVVG